MPGWTTGSNSSDNRGESGTLAAFGFSALRSRHGKDDGASDKVRWHFWRLEGPGFVWNFRPLPHVHCFVNVLQA